MIFYFTRHPGAAHVHMKVRGTADVDVEPAFTIGAKMFKSLDAFVEQAQVAGLSEESLNEIRIFAYSLEPQGEAKSQDIEISVERLRSLGFTLEHGKERHFVVSYTGSNPVDEEEAVVVTAKERDALPRTMPEIRLKTMLLSDLNEKLYMIERTINDLHYPGFGPNLPGKAVLNESDLNFLLD